jgi:hypothetical protein
MDGEIVNRVSNSSLIQIDLEEWYEPGKRIEFDLAPFLFEGLILRELEFRTSLKMIDWTSFTNAHVGVFCSADAIVPTWAFMLVAQHLAPFADSVSFGRKDEIEKNLFERWISKLDVETYRDQKVIVKGCSKFPVPLSAYIYIASKLTPVVQSLMFGEPCSNVPLYKRKKPLA